MRSLVLTTPHRLNKSKYLSRLLGGVWSYDGFCSWTCDDNKSHVCRCSAGVDEWDNDLGAEYWLYRESSSDRIYFYERLDKHLRTS